VTGWGAGNPKLGLWLGRKLHCQVGCEFFDHTGVKKKVSAQILRDTCAVRQLRRGEEIERVLLRLGLSETTWEDAKVKYQKLSAEGL
jgi:hypothetical protein